MNKMKSSKHPASAKKGRRGKEKKSTTLTPSARLVRAMNECFSDLESLRDLFEIVVPILKGKDEQLLKDLESSMNSLREMVKEKKKVDINKVVSASSAIYETGRKILRADRLFRSNAIISLIARYEDFLREIYAAVFRAHPARLAKEERSLSYTDAMSVHSVEELEQKFISKEVDRISNGSYLDQAKALQGQFARRRRICVEATEDQFVRRGSLRRGIVSCVTGRRHHAISNRYSFWPVAWRLEFANQEIGVPRGARVADHGARIAIHRSRITIHAALPKSIASFCRVFRGSKGKGAQLKLAATKSKERAQAGVLCRVPRMTIH
jgi:hypothetical protein